MPRRLTRTLPSSTSNQIKSSYYADTEGAQSNTCGVASTVGQAGFLKSQTDMLGVVTNFVYDELGRTVGTKRSGDGGWSCVVFDDRGQVLSTTVPAYGAEAASTTTHDYAVGGNPLVSSVTDEVGTITTGTDLLGRTVTYVDVWSTVTETAYSSQVGRIDSVTTTTVTTVATPVESESTSEFGYDLDGKVTQVKVDDVVVATPQYDATRLLESVNYGNGTSLTGIMRDKAGATIGIAWSFTGASNDVSDSVVRSQTGRIVSTSLTDGAETDTGVYTFDGAGRLIGAVLDYTTTGAPGSGEHELEYDYGTSAGCGAQAAANVNGEAGMNGNRTGFTDTHGGVEEWSVDYCYNNGDQLTALTLAAAPSGAAMSELSIEGMSATLAYDAHGNTVTFGDQTLGYNIADEHVSTTIVDAVAGNTTITYTRDATGRIVERQVDAPGTTDDSVLKFSFAGGGDGAYATLADDQSLKQRTISLPGGVGLICGSSVTAGSWSYPNIHGDVIVTADSAGARTGVRAAYDPFGQLMDPLTGSFGTEAANDASPDTIADEDADYAYVGQHQKLYEHTGTIATIEMGARQYVPALGRFLEVDPVEGGVSNAYDYPSDPVNRLDLSGEFAIALVPVLAVALLIAVAVYFAVYPPQYNWQVPAWNAPNLQPIVDLGIAIGLVGIDVVFAHRKKRLRETPIVLATRAQKARASVISTRRCRGIAAAKRPILSRTQTSAEKARTR